MLIGEMSSEGNLATGDYTTKTVEMALKHKDFVMGFITQNKLTDEPGMIHMTPGLSPSLLNLIAMKFDCPLLCII